MSSKAITPPHIDLLAPEMTFNLGKKTYKDYLVLKRGTQSVKGGNETKTIINEAEKIKKKLTKKKTAEISDVPDEKAELDISSNK